MQEKFQNKSFTLIEMLVVVVIIGILAGVLVPRLVGARERASDAGRLIKVGQLTTAVELYAQSNSGFYPVPSLSTGSTVAMIADEIVSFISPIPTDPGKGVAAIESTDCLITGDSFAYYSSGRMYAITARMESKKGNTSNCLGVIDSDKQGLFQVVGKGLIYKRGVYFVGGETIVTDGTYVYTMMDKNLGATLSGTTSLAYGYYFQWGNNFGFRNGVAGSSNSSGVASFSYNSTIVTNPTVPFSSYYFVRLSDWASPSNPSLRAEGTQGPCPNGYHVPRIAERRGLIDTRKRIYTTGTTNTALLRDTLKLPMVGYRSYSTANINAQGSNGTYWSSSASGTNSYSPYFLSSTINTEGVNYRGYGLPVRCFKN